MCNARKCRFLKVSRLLKYHCIVLYSFIFKSYAIQLWFSKLFGSKNTSVVLPIDSTSKPKTTVDIESNLEVLERGYDAGDEFYLHEQQKGKLVGIESLDGEGRRWAANDIERSRTIDGKERAILT